MDTSTTMSQMMMVFANTITTPLYSTSWTPTTRSQYAGTCIFLLALAVIFRGLLAYKSVLERAWLLAEMDRVYVSDGTRMQMRSKRADENVTTTTGRLAAPCRRPWRFSTDGPRALLDTAVVGVGYLLMLAVMTMNVGYFLSILGGTFVGSLVVGRYAVSVMH